MFFFPRHFALDDKIGEEFCPCRTLGLHAEAKLVLSPFNDSKYLIHPLLACGSTLLSRLLYIGK